MRLLIAPYVGGMEQQRAISRAARKRVWSVAFVEVRGYGMAHTRTKTFLEMWLQAGCGGHDVVRVCWQTCVDYDSMTHGA